VIAQILTANGDELFYYTFTKEDETHIREIDFLLHLSTKIGQLMVLSFKHEKHQN